MTGDKIVEFASTEWSRGGEVCPGCGKVLKERERTYMVTSLQEERSGTWHYDCYDDEEKA